MKTNVVHFENFSISIPDGWVDVTDSLDDPQAPLTIANGTSGVGALQFSAAVYKSGKVPNVGMDDLEGMLTELAENKGFGRPIGHATYTGETRLAGGTYRADDNFVEAWYASDGKNILLATYVCDWSEREREAAERDVIFRSIKFTVSYT